MATQDDEYLQEIEAFAKMIDALAEGIIIEYVRIKNKIIRALGDITYVSVSDTIRDKAREQMKRLKAIPNVAIHLQKSYASIVNSKSKYH